MGNQEPLQQTILHPLHEQLGAQMVSFAGYSMPIQYPAGIKTEHLHCRAKAGLFDVSHMGQVIITGEGVATELEKLIPVDLQNLTILNQKYGLLTLENGAILDDLIINRWDDNQFFLVLNAGCKAKDLEHIANHLPKHIDIKVIDNALIALQGPSACAALEQLFPKISRLSFMQGCQAQYEGHTVFITRSGYTGEDGFEISMPEPIAIALSKKLLDNPEVAPIGLGARDSLRLEGGLCLYGQDLDQQTTAIESGLNWSISPARRASGANAGGFLGDKVILAQMANGAPRKRVGLIAQDKAPVRAGSELQTLDGQTIGVVTSGVFSPSLDKPIAMGYITVENAVIGTQIQALVRGKPRLLDISKMPFVPANYHRG